jgi:hypothetical protein
MLQEFDLFVDTSAAFFRPTPAGWPPIFDFS